MPVEQLHADDKDESVVIAKDSVLKELVSAVDEATLESVALGGALFAGIETAKLRVSRELTRLSTSSNISSWNVFGIDCSCFAPVCDAVNRYQE
jgi:hypothetical protein